MKFKDLFYKWGSLRDWVVVVFIILSVISFFLLIGTIAELSMKKGCNEQAEIMGVDNHYGLFTKCMFEIDGQWIPSDQYVITQIEVINPVPVYSRGGIVK